LNQESGTFTRYLSNDQDPTSLSYGFIRGICEDTTGNLWLATQGGGLNVFNPNTEIFTHFKHQRDNSQSITSNIVWHVEADDNNNIWVSTDTGLDRVIQEDGEYAFLHYAHDPNASASLSQGSVYLTFTDSKGQMWVGTDYGLDRYNEKNDSFFHYQRDDTDPQSLSDNQVWAIFEDQTGLMWFGTHWGGLNLYNPAQGAFNHYTYKKGNPNGLSNKSILAFHQDRDGDIWIGVDHGGVNLFDRATKTFKHYMNMSDDPTSLSSNPVLTFGEDSEGNLWVGTWGGGVNRFDKVRETFTRFLPDELDPGSLCNPHVYSVFEDKLGNLWFGTHDCGLHLYIRTTGKFTHFFPDGNDSTKLSSGRIWAIFEDSRNNLWICTNDGLNLFDRNQQTCKVYKSQTNDPKSLPSNAIHTIFEDSKSRLWFGTGGGLCSFDYDTNTFKTYNTNDGLPNDQVANILEDNLGNLWLGTFQGLSKFNPDQETFQTYLKNDGILSNSINKRACLKSQVGEMYFGSPEGFISFFPDDVRSNLFTPPIVITDFQVFNKPVSIGLDSPLKKDITITKEITLSHKDYVFSFEFAALDYTVPEKNRYEYILEGFEKEWNSKSFEDRRATYTNLPPGDYIFKVRGTNNDGIWSTAIREISITVLPPWWRMKWFIITVASLMILLVAGSFFWQRKLAKNREKKLENLVVDRTGQLLIAKDEAEKARNKAESANKAKSTFLSNMSHELRTPLNSILGYTQLLARNKELDQKQKAGLDVVMTSGQHLLGLINDLLDLSKIETHKITLAETEIDLSRCLNDVVSIIQIRAQKKGLLFTQRFSENLPTNIRVDSKRLSQVLLNLLTNSIKFTNEGEVAFEVAPVPTSLPEMDSSDFRTIRFTVRDTGIGIPEDKLDAIFTAFTQVKDQDDVTEGTGLGLTISQQIVDMMGGTIIVESMPNEGSTFWFDISVQKVARSAKKEDMSIDKIAGYDGDRKSILIVDDNQNSRTFLVDILGHLDFTVYEAVNGKEAVEMVEKNSPDLILMDYQMPIMNGLEAIRQIKTKTEHTHSKIIMVSASASEHNQKESMDAGADDFLTKPVQYNYLFAALERQLKIKWSYDKKSTDRKSEVSRAPKDNQPSTESIKQLYAIAKKYEYKKIKDLLTDIEKREPSVSDFCQKISRLVDDFRMVDIIAILQDYLDDET